MGVSGRRKEDSMQEHPSETLKDRTQPNPLALTSLGVLVTILR